MMTKEEYKKELVRMWDSLRTINKGKSSCDGVLCGDCQLSLFDGCSSAEDIFDIYKTVEKWSKEHPPKKYKVSQLEYDILKYISDNTIFIYIARDENGKNYIFEAEPRKLDDWWYGCGLSYMRIFDELFQFVQWEDEEPTSIQNVLENCEVEKDDE